MSSASSHSRGPSRLGDRALVVLEVIVGLAVVSALVGRAYGPAPTVVFLLAAVATAFTLYVVVRMITALRDDTLEVTGRTEDEERNALEHEKLLILRGIKELEADLATGKTDRADYHQLRRTAEARAIEIIRQLKASDERWRRHAERLVQDRLGAEALRPIAEEVEKEAEEGKTEPDPPEGSAARARRSALPALFDLTPTVFEEREGRLVCAHCDAENEADGRFCMSCGRPRREAAA